MMTKRQIRLAARRLLNGEQVTIDNRTFKAELRKDGVGRLTCDDCNLHCPAFSDIGMVCCELEIATSKPYRLVPVYSS